MVQYDNSRQKLLYFIFIFEKYVKVRDIALNLYFLFQYDFRFNLKFSRYFKSNILRLIP